MTMPKCCACGKFVSWEADNGTMYGCSSYDPPEPHDPDYWCEECAEKEYQDALKKGDQMYIYWAVPMWQSKALEKLGLKKIVERGVPRLVPILAP